MYNAWNIYFISGNVRCVNLISLQLIQLSQHLPGAAGFHLRTEGVWKSQEKLTQTGVHSDQKPRSLDNEASTSDSAVDVACPQSILGKGSSVTFSARLYAAG